MSQPVPIDEIRIEEIRACYVDLPEHMQSMAILDVLRLCDEVDRLTALRTAAAGERPPGDQAMPETIWIDREDMIARPKEPGFTATAYVRADIHDAALAETALMEQALDKAEIESGLSTNGGYWRWWAAQARETARKLVLVKHALAERDMQALQDAGQACDDAKDPTKAKED